MKQTPAENTVSQKQGVHGNLSIAWFKLAEFVSRGEKERALGIYRLLSYSITDAALNAQLEGDILIAFSDERALESYHKAILLYNRAQQPMHLFPLYCNLISGMVLFGRVSSMYAEIERSPLTADEKTRLHEYTIRELLQTKNSSFEPTIHEHLDLVLSYYIEHQFPARMTSFLSMLSALAPELRASACEKLKLPH